MRRAALFFLALPLLAEVSGVVVNKTAGKPQGAATVTIYKLGEAGMESVETVKSDAAGKFVLQTVPQGPHLIQTAFDGVTYNKMLPPGAPLTGIELEVFQSQGRPGDAKVTQHMILFEPTEDKLLVSENVIYQNDGKLTYNNPGEGTLRFYLPPEAKGKVRIMGSAPNGMPVERAAKPLSDDTYGVDFPIKPGETRFQVNYEMPLPSPAVFTGKVLHKEGTTRLVTPRGVSLKGAGIQELGREPATQAAIYNLTGSELKVEIEGTGSLREAAPEEEGPGIQEILPRLYDRFYVVLGLSGAILALGFVALYRRPTSPAVSLPATPAAPTKGKRRG